ncbi:hypothetical protein FDB30_01315 [Clostridium botulinum]|uniref:ATPase dynein-related AAA domain-containing protein n=1 Tax=Clostridium botulinum TaxID=1491 RepID=A0A846JZH7_CLOBO|nr:AAA family ATPase [Clostridium botulinum]NFG28697.1 hypothetical protein [Clostridium botulinum]NFG37193.1 hypothetical protein [Clostridium botulinum]NFN04523.1 hypothetical protein [Clostridium botulinum]NFN16041.1 hypothetical protein [Clostridium botulinum]NFN36775.1 hypothetical protein [Clostridium botulinum]
MTFTPIIRWRNFTLENLKAILEIYPDLSRNIKRSEVNNILEDEIKGYKKTAYQFSCQLGIEDRGVEYLHVQNYLFSFSDEQLEKYLEFWIKTYYAPNPYVKGDEEPILIYKEIGNAIINSNKLEMNFTEFFDSHIGGKSFDILCNVIVASGYPIKKREIGANVYFYIEAEKKEELSKTIEKISNEFSIPQLYKNPQIFFERYTYQNYAKFFDIDMTIEEVKDTSDSRKNTGIIIGENTIYYGAPGTGKSYTVNEKSKKFDYVERVTFYPEYTHDDFIGCFMPVMSYEKENPKKTYVFADNTPSNITGKPVPYYTFVDGPFTKALVYALKNPNENVLLIIEELNRANAAAVFGEIFQLLDRKYEGQAYDGESRYEISISNEFSEFLASQDVPNYKKGDKIKIPCNLSIYATMNSADQGVNPLDSAFKRRWNFIYVPIDFNEVEHKEFEIDYAEEKVTWEIFATTINKQLKSKDINEDKHLGEYFVNKNEITDKYKFASKILLYLFDDVLKFNKRGFFKTEYKTFSDLLEGFNNGKEIFDFKFETKNIKQEVVINSTIKDDETSSMVYEEQNEYEDSSKVAEESEDEI